MSTQIHQAIEWTGKSGTAYRYYIWPRGSLVDGGPPGNFIVVRETAEGVLAPVFIGQAEDLNHRATIEDPKIQQCIHSAGAKQLHLHSSYKSEQARNAEAADLIARWGTGLQRAREEVRNLTARWAIPRLRPLCRPLGKKLNPMAPPNLGRGATAASAVSRLMNLRIPFTRKFSR